jgi:non-specific serine/threonine protein kinase/serine/threonine-protein kinase
MDFLHDHPTDVGPYHILGVIGQGGMGIVYKAEQREPVRRLVALKLIKLGMDTADVIARFEGERQALAVMNHPSVAKVFDAGATERGRPYFVMEYVAGEPITAFCDRAQLPIAQRLELFAQACDAIQHAHQKAIIHRDLKPSNILVSLVDGNPLVKVIDFGVAKAISQRLTERTLFTEMGQLIGTPEYMSPEQAEMSGADVDTRTDIYALGVVLYELLAGTLPFDARSLRSAGYREIQRIIREVDPPRPSTRLSSLGNEAAAIAQRRKTQLAMLAKQLRTELEWIPLKAMRKDRTERYATAAELAADVRNYLASRPLQAGPPSATYRLRKFIRRNTAGVAASAAIVFLLIAGIITTTWQAVRATRAQRDASAQRQQAELKQQESQAVVRFLTEHVLAGATPERMPDTSVRDAIVRVMLDPAAAAIAQSLADAPLVEASVRVALANCYRALGRADLGAPHADAALARRRAKLGDGHADTIDAMVVVAAVQRDRGLYADAERWLTIATDVARRSLGEQHAQFAAVRRNVGDLLLAQGRYAEAESVLRAALDDARRNAATTSPRAAIAIFQDLAQTLMALGKFDEAEAMFRESLDRARRDLGERDPTTIGCVSNLAQIVERRGKLAEARALYAEAADEARAVLGPDHMHTLIMINNLASVSNKLGDRAEAERRYREVIEAMRRTLGPEHPSTLTSLNNLGTLLSDQRRSDEAEPILRETLAGRRRALTDDHPQTVQSLYALTNILYAQQRDGEGEPLLAELYERASRAQLPANQVARFMAGWGPCLVRVGRYQDAEAPLREAYRRLIETDQRVTKEMSRVLGGLASVCENTGRPDEAGQWRAELEALLASTRATATNSAPTSLPRPR